MAIEETTFNDLTLSERKIAYAVYNKMTSRSIDFKSKVLSESDNILMVKADGSEAGYRTMKSLKESVEDLVVSDYSATVTRLNDLSARAYETTIGNGGKTYTVVHALNTESIMCQLWGNNYNLPFYEVKVTDENTISISFDEDVPTDAVNVVVQSNKYSVMEG